MAIKYQFEKSNSSQIHQGDIFRDVPFYESYSERGGGFELSVLEFPLSIVLTQECDLKQCTKERVGFKDRKSESHIMHDKFLVSLLCAPLYNAEQLFGGMHLSELGIKSEIKNSSQRNFIKTNREPRYHYIELDGEIEIVPSVIDFKHYFSISLSYLENRMQNRICSIKPIFRESISQRFSNYLARIGLPEQLNINDSSA